MRCAQIKEWISGYIDGELDHSRSVILEQHLKECRECRQWLDDLKTIKQTAGRLNEPVPSTDWETIQARLKQKEPSGSRSFKPVRFFPGLKPALAAAAAVFIIVAAAVVSWNVFDFPAGISANGSRGTALSKLQEAENHYQSAIQSLKEAAEAREGSLDPNIKLIFEANLEIINSSIAYCKQAVLEYPEEVDTRNFLLTAYREKMDLLYRMVTYQSRSSDKKIETTI
jgi:hypothetical protein